MANNWTHDYNPLQPWEEVFVQIIHQEETWWRDEAREPLSFVKTGAANMSEHITGVAPVSASTASSSTAAAALAAPAVHAPPAAGHVRPARKTNNKNVPICSGFTAGTCLKLGPNSRCASDGQSVHQCCYCLSNAHSGDRCPVKNTPAKAPAAKRRKRA